MKKLIKSVVSFFDLYKTFCIQYLKQLLEYRVDFITGSFSFLITQLTNIVFISLVFSQIPSLAGWKYNEIVFIYAFSLLPKGLDHLFTDNLWSVANSIVLRGEMDKYLTRPINPLLHIIMEKLQIDAIGEILLGVILIVSSVLKLEIKVNIFWVISFIIFILLGAIIFASIKIIFASISFWTKKSDSILKIVYNVSDFVRYPNTIYGKMLRVVLTYIIPFAFTAYYPCLSLLRSQNEVVSLLICMVISLLLFALSLVVWNAGLSKYESAGS